MKEALSSLKKAEWRKAMEKEMKSLHTDEVWDLFDGPVEEKLSLASGFSNENMMLMEA